MNTWIRAVRLRAAVFVSPRPERPDSALTFECVQFARQFLQKRRVADAFDFQIFGKIVGFQLQHRLIFKITVSITIIIIIIVVIITGGIGLLFAPFPARDTRRHGKIKFTIFFYDQLPILIRGASAPGKTPKFTEKKK